MVKWGIFSIDMGTCNLGNRLIEHAVVESLGLPPPTVAVTMFKIPNNEQITELNKMDFLIVPGATTLANGPWQADALAILPKIKVPVVCVGSGSWNPMYRLNTKACQYMVKPIGVRDPHTLAECKQNGISATLTGCPTLFMPRISAPEYGDYTVIGFARNNFQWQELFFKNLHYPNLIAGLQEIAHEKPLAEKITKKFFTYESIDEVTSWLGQCKRVVTGRLHSILPAIAQGRSVLFFGDPKDSRFSLLKHLGITINPLGGPFEIWFQHEQDYIENVNNLKQVYKQWAYEVFHPLGFDPIQ
jgi:hypothetical protein